MAGQNLFKELEKLFRMESTYCTEDGVLLKNAIVEAALALRPELITKLLTHDGLKRNFFTEVEGVLVFDKIKFQKFVMNKRFLPDSYTSFKNKVGLTTEDSDFLSESREVVLSWPYKDCVLEGGQTKEDAKRNEVFWNEILAPDEINRLIEPKVLTNFRRYDANGEHEVDSISMDDNLIIKGNNLLALHTLKKKYAGKVKLIYIDPPYNTGNDSFGYNDNFNHSTWLTFMRNRLEVAKKLLKDDGVIFVQCDDNEHAYLKVLMDEVFGRENFLSVVVVKMSTVSGVKTAHREKTILKEKEYGIIFKKGPEITITPEYIPDTEWDDEFQYVLFGKYSGEYIVRKLKDVLMENGIKFDANNTDFKSYIRKNADIIWRRAFIRGEMKEKSLKRPNEVLVKETESIKLFYYRGRQMFFLSEKYHDYYDNEGKHNGPSILLGDIWHDVNTARIFNEGGVDFRNAKKPEQLISRIIRMFSSDNDIILDFFLGSGTTSAVAHKLNRRYIGIEQINSQISLITERLSNVINGEQGGISKSVKWQGGGSFVYCELAKANQQFADNIEQASSTEELATIWEQMQETGFLSWKVNPKEINANADDFTTLAIEDQKRFLIECLDKNLLYIPYSEIDNAEFGISENDKKINNQFYQTK